MSVDPNENRPWLEADESRAEHGLEADHGEQAQEIGGRQPSTAPNNSMQTGAGDGTTGYDSPPIGSVSLPNPDVDGVEHEQPYYPPGGARGSLSKDEAGNDAEESGE